MKFKRLLSLALCIVMMFSMSTEVFAAININIDGENVIQVETSANQFFNVEFAPPEYEPNAEEVYYMNMGQDLAIWRHSGDMNKNEAGSQNWNTPWGYKTDRWVQELMRGEDKGIILTLNQQIPWGVKNFIENGGTWNDIKITFQCVDKYGTSVEPTQVFKNGKVDGWLKWGTEIQLSFYPLFYTDTENYIYNGNAVKLNRGMYPYSFTMFSMWSKGKHYGATRIWDSTFGEPDTYTGEGFKPLQYTDILSSTGDITSGYYKNVQYTPGVKTETGHKAEPGISGDAANIGLGTFSSGGATGLGFNFPVRVTFEINPIKAKEPNLLYVSEYSIVNMADDAKPDEMTTHASMQAYSNRAQLLRFFGSEELYNRVVKMICAEAFNTDDDTMLGLFADNAYNNDVVCALLDKASAGELNTLIEKAKADMNSEELKKYGDSVSADIKGITDTVYNGSNNAVGKIDTLDNESSRDIRENYTQENTYNAFENGRGTSLNAYQTNKEVEYTALANSTKADSNTINTGKLEVAKSILYKVLGVGKKIQPDDVNKISFLDAMVYASLRQAGIYTDGDMKTYKENNLAPYIGLNALTHVNADTLKGEITMIYENDGSSIHNNQSFMNKVKETSATEYFARMYGHSISSYLEIALGTKYAESADGNIIKAFLYDSLPQLVKKGDLELYDIQMITEMASNMVAKNARGELTPKEISNVASAVTAFNLLNTENAPTYRVLSGRADYDSMNNDEKMAFKSSSIGKYLLKDDSGTISTSTSIIKTGNMAGMMDEIEKSDSKTVILLPTISHAINKEIGQDAFRKLAYARAERLYDLIRKDKVFSKVKLSDGYRERLITDNEDDLMVLDINKYYDEMSFSNFKNEQFYHTGYISGSISETVFTRIFGADSNVKHTSATLYDLGIVGDKTATKERDLLFVDIGSSTKIKEKYTDNCTRLWNTSAFKFNTGEEIENFLEDAIWRSGDFPVNTSEIPYDEMTIEGSLNYDGGIAYTDVIIDKGCDIVVSGFSIRNDGEITELKKTKQGITFPYTLPVAATRYSMVAPFANDYYKGLENPALTDEVYGAYSMIACIPEGMDNNEFYENAKKLVAEAKASGKVVDGAVLEGHGIRIHVGKESVKNTLVYPSKSQLDNGTPIRLAMFYAEIENPEIVKVYTLTDGVSTTHVKTVTAPAVVNDDTVKIEDETMDGTEYKVAEAYVSTDLYDAINTTPWSEITSNTNVYDGEVIYNAGDLSLDPEKQQRIYVKMEGELPTPIPPAPGDYVLTQQTIGKKFDTSGLGIVASDKLTSFASTRHRYYTRKGRVRRCNIYSTSDDTYKLDYTMNTSGDTKVFSNITPIESGDKTGARTWSRSRTSNTTLRPKYTFVAWRGYDKPVAASYANDSWVLDDVYSKFGIGSDKQRGNSELNSSYTKDSQFKWTIGSGSDTSVRFSCSHGYTHSGTVGQYGSASNNGRVSVAVYEGWKGAQSPTNSSAASTYMGGATLTSAHKGTTTGDVIAYYPYVMMKYQDINGNTNSVNVLSKYKSTITPVNTIDFGIQRGSNSSLGITSSMWSTHKRAVNAKGNNNVIAGGATYNLGNNGAQLPTVGITTYQWYVPNDAAGAVVNGASNTQARAEQAHNDAVNSLKTALTGNKVLQHLKAGSNNFVVTPGMSTPWLGSGLNLTNNTNAESKKYWFGGMVNPKTKVVSDGGTTREYYRVSSNTNGDVILTKGSHADHVFNINQDTSYILNNMNGEWKEIEAKTGLVSAYLGSIIRRAGSDTSYGAANGWWYNEAFPGLCVVKQTSTFTVGMDTGSNASLQNVVDMRLVAGGSNSKADIYKNFNDSWFAVEGKNVNFTFRGSSLTLNTGELNLRSKTFYIPNATVYDND